MLVIASACVVIAAGAIAYLHPILPGGGKSPARHNFPPADGTASIQNVRVLSGLVAWVLTSGADGRSYIYATEDGGRVWRKLPTPAGAAYGIQLLDARHGTLQLRDGLFVTSDSGATWRNVQLSIGQTFGLGAQFINPSVGWYLDLSVDPNSSQQPTAMWWTTDAGASWSQRWRVDARQPKAGNIPLEGIKYVLGFRDTSTGWLFVQRGTTGDLLQTSDAGQTWLPVTLPMNEPAIANSLAVLHDGAIVLTLRTASGWWAIPSRDGGRSWEQPRSLSIGSPSSGQAADLPSFMDHDHWTAADINRLLTTSDAGKTWKAMPVSLPRGVTRLLDLWLLPLGGGWATGDDNANGPNRLLHTVDGGANWSLIRLPG